MTIGDADGRRGRTGDAAGGPVDCASAAWLEANRCSQRADSASAA